MKARALSFIDAFAALDRVDRKILFASASVPGNLLMFLWKLVVLVIAPSTMILSNAIFTLGVACGKILAIRAHRMAGGSLPVTKLWQEQRIYRTVGWIVLSLALCYVGFGILGHLIGGAHQRYDLWLAIAIAAIAFTEFGLSLGGAIWARRNRQLVLESIRMANLAGAIVLIALTQTAILSVSYDGDLEVLALPSAIFFGSIAAALGVSMVLRPLPSSAQNTSLAAASTAAAVNGTVLLDDLPDSASSKSG